MNILDGKRLMNLNIKNYLKSIYGTDCVISQKERNFNSIGKTVLQKDYGEKSDCTLVAITNIIKKDGDNVQSVYNVVESIARRYFYGDNSYGIIPCFIKPIYNRSYKEVNGELKKTKWNVLKDIGFNFDKIKKLVDNSTPIILSIRKDGREYYKNHSVVIVGYVTYQVNDDERKFLLIYDNWNNGLSYIDYALMSKLSCINY